MLMAWQDKQVGKNKNFWRSLYHASSGLKEIFIEEKNMRRHFFATLLVLIVGVICQLPLTKWLWLFSAIFTVISLETINTLCENMVDLIVGPHFHPLAKKIKDMAAGLVLVGAIYAVLVGLFIFGPYLFLWISK